MLSPENTGESSGLGITAGGQLGTRGCLGWGWGPERAKQDLWKGPKGVEELASARPTEAKPGSHSSLHLFELA